MISRVHVGRDCQRLKLTILNRLSRNFFTYQLKPSYTPNTSSIALQLCAETRQLHRFRVCISPSPVTPKPRTHSLRPGGYSTTLVKSRMNRDRALNAISTGTNYLAFIAERSLDFALLLESSVVVICPTSAPCTPRKGWAVQLFRHRDG